VKRWHAWLRNVSLPWCGAGLLAVVVIAATAGVLFHLREDQVAAQTRELGLLSLAQARELTRGIQGAAEGMQALRTELSDATLRPSSPGIGPALKTRADLMPLIRSLWLVDAEGRLLAASDGSAVPALQAFSRLPPGSTDLSALGISRPVPDGPSGGELIVLAMRFSSPRAQLEGFILAGIPSELLLGSFGPDSPLIKASVTLFDHEGFRLAGARVAEEGPAAWQSRQVGVHRISSNGKTRLVARREVETPPVTILIEQDIEVVLASWRETARFALAGMLLLLSILFVAVALIERSRAHQDQARQALHAQLARASKLESLGTLAGGVAHDFNNVLAAILGYAEMAQDGVVQTSAAHRHLEKVIQAALRGKALVERILTFSRGGAHTSQVFELAPLVDEVLGMLSASLRSGIVIERDFAARGARIQGDPIQLFEAVMNLCTNALQAMHLDGTLKVELARTEAVQAKVLSHGRLQPGRYIVLRVSDQGHGIDGETMERLFEPFFTTRAAQSGTGLGLAVVHGVVTELGGAVDVWSKPGLGSRFSVYLPQSSDAPTTPEAQGEPMPGGQGQLILVVDDQAELVSLNEALLHSLGYQTLGLCDPAAALDEVRADPARFAALVTDEVMPGMTGTALIEAVRRIAPDLPALLVSGYGGPLLVARAAAAGATAVLGKPLQRTQLGLAVAKALAPAPRQ